MMLGTKQKDPNPTAVDTSEFVRYKVFLEKFARLVDAVSPDVVKFAVNALSKSLISEYNKCQAENPFVQEYDRASVLMSQILPKIKDSAAHFVAFVGILQEMNITKLAHELKKAVDPTNDFPVSDSRTRGEPDSGSASGAESVCVTGFQCPCGQCSLEKYFEDRSKCPGLQESAFPFLNTSHLNRDKREDLEHQLIADTNRIKKEFQKLSDAVFKALKGTKAPISEIRSAVFSSAKAGRSKTIQTVHGDKLETITTIFDLKSFLIRYEYISFINYGILEALIEGYNECEECRTDLDSYLQKFKDFCKRNIFEVPSDIFNSSSTPDNLLVVKVIDEMWFGAERDTPECPFTLRDIKSVQTKIAEIIGHDRRFIHLIDVGNGCIQLAFAILSCQDAPIFPLSTSQLSELISHGIIVLYQPKVPSLPTNIQDIGDQNRVLIQFTENETPPFPSSDDSKTPPIPSTGDSKTPSVPSAGDSKTPPVSSADDSKTPPVPSTIDSETPPVSSASDSKTPPISSASDSKTPPVPSTIDSETPPVSSASDSKTPPVSSASDSETPPIPSADLPFTFNPIPPLIKTLGSQFIDDTSMISSDSGYSGSIASSSVSQPKDSQHNAEEATCNRALNDMAAKLRDLEKKVKNLKGDLSRAQEDVASAECSRRSAESERDKLQDEITSATSKANSLSEEKLCFEGRLNTLEKDLKKEQMKSESAQEMARKAQQQADSVSAELFQLQSTVVKLESNKSQLEKQVRELCDRIEEAESMGVRKMEVQLASNETCVSSLEEQLDVATKDKETHCDLLHQDTKIKELLANIEKERKMGEKYKADANKALTRVTVMERKLEEADHNGVSAEPPIVANSASPSNAKTGNIQCHNFFAVRLQITIPDHSFEINVKEGSTDEAVEAYLHVHGCQADASLQATANEILEEYYAIGTSLQFTGKAEVVFSVVFYSEDCLQTFVKKLKDIEKALAKRFEELLCQPKTQRKAQKSSATPQEKPDQHLDLQCKLEVFLAEETPGEEYPTDMTMVTSENLSYFLKKWPCNTAEKIKLHEVHKECMGVVDWIDLGVQLKIPETTLQEIDRDNPKIRGKRVEMLIKWSELETLTWEKLIRALINIGERAAAETIAKQQGVPFPTNLKPCTYQPRGPSSEWTQSGSSSGNDIETAIHNLYNQEKKLYHYGSQVLTLTEEKNDLKKLLQMSYKMRDYLINKDVDYSESQKEIALLEKQLKNKEEEISLAKEKFLSLCREILAKLKDLVNERETSDEDHHDDDVVDETHPKQQMIRAKQLEIQRIKAEVKQLSMTIDGNQDEIETLFNLVECSIATMDDTEYSRKSDRLIMLLKSTIPMKEELRVLIQKKIDAEKELKAMKDVLPAKALKLLKTCHSTMDSLDSQLGKLDAKKSVVELCENYTYEVKVPQLKVVSISGHENCTVCMDCGQICDRNCGVTDSHESIGCCAIDSSSGYCTICPGRCHHTRHRSTADSICEVTTSTEIRTIEKLKEAHDKAKDDLSALKNKVTEYKQELEENLKVLRLEFEKHLREAGHSSEFDRIAEAVKNAECAVT